jgi:hypothetical protein
VGARRTWRIEPDPAHGRQRNAGEGERRGECLREGLDRDPRTFQHQAGHFDQFIDQKPTGRVEHRGLVGVTAVVEPNHHVHAARMHPYGY